jgi:hypothetical protein
MTFLALIAASLLAVLFGCDSNVDEQIALAKLAQSCLVNSDCSAPLVCAFEACHAECESSRDCPEGARCVAAARPYMVCQLEAERLCERTADCVEGLVCGVDGECRDQCLTESDCVEGQLCVSGTCADSDELDESGQLPVAGGGEYGAEGSPCVYVSDCSEALLCRSQVCLAQCKADKDCPLGELCSETRCISDGSQPVACDYSSQCDTEQGERCLGGSCLCQCVEDRDCAAGELCNGCGCEADPDAPPACVYDSDCDSPQICKNRLCSCECLADADCAAGFACEGCGCIPDGAPVEGIVNGDVFVYSTLQLDIYRGVTEIRGDLGISTTDIESLGDTFDQLKTITGWLTVSENGYLTSIAFPNLETVERVQLVYSDALESVDLPQVTATDFVTDSLTGLKSVSLDALTAGQVVLANAPALEQLALPQLQTLEAFKLSGVTLLASLSLPELTTLTGSFEVLGNGSTAPGTISAPQLVTLGEYASVSISTTAITSLAAFGADGWDFGGSSIYLYGNSQLSDCAAEEFVARAKEGGFAYDALVSSNLACATTCDGATCVE